MRANSCPWTHSTYGSLNPPWWALTNLPSTPPAPPVLWAGTNPNSASTSSLACNTFSFTHSYFRLCSTVRVSQSCWAFHQVTNSEQLQRAQTDESPGTPRTSTLLSNILKHTDAFPFPDDWRRGWSSEAVTLRCTASTSNGQFLTSYRQETGDPLLTHPTKLEACWGQVCIHLYDSSFWGLFLLRHLTKPQPRRPRRHNKSNNQPECRGSPSISWATAANNAAVEHPVHYQSDFF